MKRFLLYLVIFLCTFSQNCYAAFNNFDRYVAENGKQVFVYHIPEDKSSDENISKDLTTNNDIISDDITADTSQNYEQENTEFSENNDEEDNNYEIDDMYSYVLKGYAEYNEEDENSISLEITENEIPVLYIKQPVKIKEKYFSGIQTSPNLFNNNIYSKYNGSEYSITPLSADTSKTIGSFSAGTTYNQSIDYGELEQSSGIYSKYQYKNFAISTSYAKTINTTNNNYNDNFYITPELKLNQYFTLKNIFSADTVKKRKKAEIVLSINPFGNRDFDRLRFEIGASETFDDMNNTLKNQFRFSTNYKF